MTNHIKMSMVISSLGCLVASMIASHLISCQIKPFISSSCRIIEELLKEYTQCISLYHFLYHLPDSILVMRRMRMTNIVETKIVSMTTKFDLER